MGKNKKYEKYELWKLKDGYEFFLEKDTSARDSLPTDAKLIWTVNASSWEEAQTKKNEYLGWPRYKPMK